MAIFVLGLALVVYLDARMLRRCDGLLFNKVFAVSPPLTFVIAGLILFHLAVVADSPTNLPPFIFVVLLSFYLLRRVRFHQLAGMGLPVPAGECPSSVLVADAYNVILIWFLAMVVIGAFVKSVGEIFPALGSEMGRLLISAVFSSAIALALIHKASRKFSDQGFWVNMGLRKGDRPLIQVILMPALWGLLFSCVSTLVIFGRWTQPSTPLYEVLEATDSLVLMGVFLILAVLAAPLIEEIIFRGYFFHVISRVKGERFAIGLISLVFGFLHMGQYWGDWAAIVMVFVLGFVLTLVRARTQTTLASVTMHYVYNAGVTVIPFYMSI